MNIAFSNGTMTLTRSNGDITVINLNSDTTVEVFRRPVQVRAAVGTGPSMVPEYVAATNTWSPQQVTTTYDFYVRINLSDEREEVLKMGEQTGSGSTWVNTQAGANIAAAAIQAAIPNS